MSDIDKKSMKTGAPMITEVVGSDGSFVYYSVCPDPALTGWYALSRRFGVDLLEGYIPESKGPFRSKELAEKAIIDAK